jgi:hypothetical protein
MTSPTSPHPERRLRLPVWAATAAAVLGAAGVVLGGTVLPSAAATGKAHGKAAAPAPRLTFGVEPASAHGADGRPYFSFGATAGAVLADHVAVVNYSTEPLSLQLYATDAAETAGGGFGLLPSTTRPAGVGAWITIPAADATIVVPRRSADGPGEVVVPIVLRIPDRASPGDHTGGIVAAFRTAGTNPSGQRVVLVLRVGTRVYVRVAGPLAPAVAVQDLRATYTGTLNPFGQGRATVSYLVANTGDVNLAVPAETVMLSGLVGDRHQVQLPSIPLLLAGASVRESTAFDGVWPQFYLRASVSARPVELPTFGAAGPVAPVAASTGTWAFPWPLAALVVIVALTSAVALRLRARRSASHRVAAAQRPEAGLAGA